MVYTNSHMYIFLGKESNKEMRDANRESKRKQKVR